MDILLSRYRCRLLSLDFNNTQTESMIGLDVMYANDNHNKAFISNSLRRRRGVTILWILNNEGLLNGNF